MLVFLVPENLIMIRVSTRLQKSNTVLILNSLTWQFQGPRTPISGANEKKDCRAENIHVTKKREI